MVDEDSITRQKSWSNLAELSAFLSLKTIFSASFLRISSVIFSGFRGFFSGFRFLAF